jgi:uncharacterized FlaG/YvyC family protein
MDIKSLANIKLLKPLTKLSGSGKDIKSGSAEDRDANGRQEGDKKEEKKMMSEEEFAQALEHIRSLPSIKNSVLTLARQDLDEVKYLIITEPSGKVVRRIPEWELWSLIQDKDKKTGQLFSRVL